MERLGPVIATVNLPHAETMVRAAREAFAAGADRVEIRLDALGRPEEALPLLDLAREMPLLVSGDREAVRAAEIPVLQRAQEAGAWVDLPCAANLPDDLWGLDRSRLILSFHDFRGTPDDLPTRVEALRSFGPAACKIVPTALDFSDLLAVRHLLDEEGGRGDLCAFAMGTPGIAARAMSLAWGSCATYASAPGCGTAAPGQPDLATLLDGYRPRSASADEPLYAVVGWPLNCTGSPFLHNRWLRDLGLPGRFVPLPSTSLRAVLEARETLNLQGLAVTIPHKGEALSLASRASRLSRTLGACNTLLPVEEGWFGANTDAFGIRSALARVPKGTPALLLGAGGAASAAAFVLARRGPLAIAARDEGKALGLADRFGAGTVAWVDRAFIPCDLLINATPCGQEGEESPVPPDAAWPEWVFDMVVREGGTPLLREARARGVATIAGEAMLEAQARLQFRLFTGRRAPREMGFTAEAQRTQRKARCLSGNQEEGTGNQE